MIIVNSGVFLLCLFDTESLRRNSSNPSDWAFLLLMVAGIVNVVCAVALLRWKKWGFWGFIASSIAVLVVNLSVGLGVASVFGGVVGIAVLYGVLQIGKEKNGWSQLE
jgi:hypothetical protein